jgi:hypothetical protein
MSRDEFLVWLDGLLTGTGTNSGLGPLFTKMVRARLDEVLRPDGQLPLPFPGAVFNPRCAVCGLDQTQATGYVCSRLDCPTKVMNTGGTD